MAAPTLEVSSEWNYGPGNGLAGVVGQKLTNSSTEASWKIWLWAGYSDTYPKTNFFVGQYDAASKTYFAFGSDYIDLHPTAKGAMQLSLSLALYVILSITF